MIRWVNIVDPPHAQHSQRLQEWGAPQYKNSLVKQIDSAALNVNE